MVDDHARVLQVSQTVEVSKKPQSSAAYAHLYPADKYKKNVQRKMIRMRNIARKSRFDEIWRKQSYLNQVDRVSELYSDAGGREHLNELVALYCYLDDLSREDADDESDDDDLPTSNKPDCKSEGEEDDSNDDKGNALIGVSEISVN
jgi:hypothetical protein